MPIVSVTRLRIRSIFYLPAFIPQTIRSIRQAEVASGFLGGRVMREARNAFWTMTMWQDAESMDNFRVKGAHGRAMPKLMEWCDEASVVHWTQETPELPSWEEAHRRMVREGRASKVTHPSAAHMAHRIPPPRPSLFQQQLHAKQASARRPNAGDSA